MLQCTDNNIDEFLIALLPVAYDFDFFIDGAIELVIFSEATVAPLGWWNINVIFINRVHRVASRYAMNDIKVVFLFTVHNLLRDTTIV